MICGGAKTSLERSEYSGADLGLSEARKEGSCQKSHRTILREKFAENHPMLQIFRKLS